MCYLSLFRQFLNKEKTKYAHNLHMSRVLKHSIVLLTCLHFENPPATFVKKQQHTNKQIDPNTEKRAHRNYKITHMKI